MIKHRNAPLNDSSTNVEDLSIRIRSFLKKRDWEKYHTPKNLAISICIEAGELLQIFQWMSEEELEIYQSSITPRVSEELADVMIYCLSMANAMKIDVVNAITAKIEINEKKYPVDKWKGRANLPEKWRL